MYDLIIVGAGPAGMTAALYALRANKKVLILEAKSYGGQILLASNIENYPAIKEISGYDYSKNLYDQIKALGVEYKNEIVLKVDSDKTVTTNDNTYQGKAVILATGASSRKLGLKNEDILTGKGVSYCATCDGNFFKNKIVAVNGGGNTAIGDALYLSNIAKKVYLIHRRDDFRADKKSIKELKAKENIEIMTNRIIAKLNGTKKLDSITIVDNDGEQDTDIVVDALFIAIGQEPKNTIFTNVAEIDENGYFISEDGVHTKTPNIYIAGDARQKVLRQLTTAVSDGSIAAVVAIKEMSE
ncbi:MAG: FAD-dependent oxidoreductase [Bacilli bacterium]|nr:FAD-dependent oxidoreductase [Bacilli bacterium]